MKSKQNTPTPGYSIVSRFIWTNVALFTLGCAGPHTPLGAVWSFWPSETKFGHFFSGKSKNQPRITFTPARQILHGPSSVAVSIQDPDLDFDNYQLSIRYNGFEVSDTFLRRSKQTHKWKEHELIIENPLVRLPPSGDHLIEFDYQNPQGQTVYARYESPRCSAYELQDVASTGDFKPSQEILKLISRKAKDEGINPALLTGLVAQESRFDPRQVSWAKAIGLTQITTSAEHEISATHETWPRYPDIDEMGYDDVRILISAGKINSTNEWRLNPALSLMGGVELLETLSTQWSNESNQSRIKFVFQEKEELQVARTRLILASYHSGYTRVSKALETYGADWLKAPELREARKYVNRVFSYCNHFAS